MTERTREELLAEGFEEVAQLSQVQEMLAKRVDFQGRGVLLCREGEALFAVDELCPHKYKSMSMGIVHQGKLTCPHHQYMFDLETGACTNRRRCAPLDTFEVVVVDDAVFLR